MALRKIHITGVVQGVGFRPFVYQLATRANLLGWVANTSAGVDMEVEGDVTALDDLARALMEEKPPLARIDSLSVQELSTNGHAPFAQFEIRASVAQEGAFQPISPDIAICSDCLRELFDPDDRRYRYPFINCTNCGPRFTIIEDLPYDRPKTTMRAFPLCDDCAREYHDPLDRRFHAQPVACPKCGPKVWLETNSQFPIPNPQSPISDADPIAATHALLTAGYIVAVKGLGGFHLACEATNAGAVQTLRGRKLRVDKPFALMMPDLATVAEHCYVGAAERELLESRARPIVILKRRAGSNIAREVAPGQDTLGVMLPYTPLHYLLIADSHATFAARPAAISHRLSALVMTSGNLSEEPIATLNEEARARLVTLADAFLMHDRDIRTRCDDSVVRVTPAPCLPLAKGESGERVYPLRRSRGYAPFPIHLPWEAPPLLATGAELKNTFCVTRAQYAFLSHHVGDLENYETLRSFEDGVAHFEQLFRVKPKALAYDLHPNYLSTRYALARAEREGLPALGVQHHHAHIAACMVENGLSGAQSVIGVAFDGTGYGDDGAIWGGEFLIADYAGYRRACQLAYVPLPGGDKAVREPWRVALAWLHKAEVAWTEELAPVRAASEQARRVLQNQIARGLHAPPTSSMGRLFDAVAAIAGVRQRVNYEAQAAIEFEAMVDAGEQGAYEFEISKLQLPGSNSQLPTSKIQDPMEVDATPLICAVVKDVRAGVPIPIIAARFHNGVAWMVRAVCRLLREQSGLSQVALSGGVWQNMTLLARAVELLRADGFDVFIHRRVPANDGGLAVGQAAVATNKLVRA